MISNQQKITHDQSKNSLQEKKNMFIFNIDRGGTFTDFYVQEIQLKNISKQNSQHTQNKVVNENTPYIIKNQQVFKFPSQSSLGQGPIVGIRNFLIERGIMQVNQQKIPTSQIFRINLGTTIATNALLQRKGFKNCMLLTKGFKDLLTMRHLARPNIFDLKCQRKDALFTEVIEVDQRVFLNQPPPQIKTQKLNSSLNKPIYRKKLQESQISRICKQIKQKGYQSVGISFCHSIINPQNQIMLKNALIKQNIEFIEDSNCIQQLGYLKRSQTTNLNVFLGPISIYLSQPSEKLFPKFC